MTGQELNGGVDIVDDQRVAKLIAFGFSGAFHHLIGDPVEKVRGHCGITSGRQFIGHVLDEFVHAAGMLGHYHGGKGAGAVGHTGINVHLGLVN